MSYMHRVVRAHADLVRIVVFRFLCRYVLRDINHYRTRTPRGRHIKGLLDGHGNIPDILDQEIMFHTGPGNANIIGFLKGIVAYQMRRNLAGKDNQGNGIHVGGGDSGNRVSGPRTGGHDNDAWFAGRTRITVSGMGRTLLMARQDML